MIIKWNTGIRQLTDEKIITPKVMLFAANEAIKLMNPFVPMASGNLANDGTIIKNEMEIKVNKHSAIITYTAPYAHDVYYGDNRHFSTLHHPKATARWCDVAMKTEKSKLVQAVEKFIKRGDGK